jgi:hypothetical protein
VGVLGILPTIPGTSCPSAASSLAALGLGPVCQLASGVSSAVGSAAGSAASSVAGFGIDSVFNGLSSWVAAGAAWLLGQIGSVLDKTTTIDLGASWFTDHYQTMAALAGLVVVPMFLLGIIQSIYRQSASMLLRSVVVNVPLAILLTTVAVKLVQLGLAVTDAMSSAVAQGAGVDGGNFMGSVATDLSGSQQLDSAGVPAFVLFIGALVVVLGALLVWVELLVRASAVYVAVLFLPLALASLAWPAIAHWSRRLVDTLVALILGKFVIVSVLSLAAGALAGGTTPISGGAGGANASAGFTDVLAGAALLLLSASAPWALFRLLPFLEAGAAGHLEGLGRRAGQSAAAPVKSLAHVALASTGVGSAAVAGAAGVGGALKGAKGAASGALAAGSSGGPNGGGPGAPGGSGGGGPGGSLPEAVPSSAEVTGVGTTESPGHDIPAWTVNPGATESWNRSISEPSGGPTSAEPSPSPSPPSAPPPLVSGPTGHLPAEAPAAAPTPLPRATGALYPGALGRDQLGVRLVGTPPAGPGRFPRGAAPPATPRSPAPPSTSDGRDA